MTETITITNRTIVAEIDLPEPPSEAERKRLGDLINREIEKTLFGGWPPGHDPGKGFGGTYYINGPPRCCHGALLHEPNCPYWNYVT